jgi:glycosyltransferase involved in cell wall biosynthesis
MRILFWSETFWPRVGGVENLAARLLPASRARGYEFVVVTWENMEISDVIHYQGIPVYRFPFFSGPRDRLDPLIENRRQVAKLKQDFAPELVHINSYGQSVLFHVSTASVHPAPVLVTLHQALPDEPVGRDSLLGHLLRTSDWVNTCSDAVLTHARQLVPEIIPCSSFIHNALDAPTFDPQPMSFDPPRLLCLGRLVAEKGFDLALTAFATVLDRFPSARLVIAGDGPEREKLQQQTIQLDLANSVEFIGKVPPNAVAHLIDEATLVLIPSRSEGFGLVALEAAWMARPVVAACVGGLPEVVVHEQTGFLVEGNDSPALAQAILRLLEHRNIARQMGQAARDRARRDFNWERHVDAYDTLYRKLIDYANRPHSGSASIEQPVKM